MPVVMLVSVGLYICPSDFPFVRMSVRGSLGFVTFVSLVAWQALDALHHCSRLAGVLSVCLSVCLFVWLSACLSVCLSVCLSIGLSICDPV